MVKIRLRRMGTRNRAFYRVVVSDGRRTPTAVSVEELGHYDPEKKPAEFSLNRERYDHWVKNGAQVSETIKTLVARG